jgi:glutamate carboxypeptidase
MDRLNLTVILSSDEEVGSVFSRPVYEEESQRASVCLVAECAGPKGEIVISRNGKAGARMDCIGKDSHIARVKGEKTSAILELARKIVDLEALNGNLPGATVNVGRVEGGLGPSTVSAQASCLLDMRWSDEKHHDILLDEVRRICQTQSQPGSTCDLTVLNRRPAMPPTEGTRTLFGLLHQVTESLGISIESEHRRGTSDANFFGAAGIPTLDGFGPICEDDHTPSERILIPSLQDRTALLALFLCRLESEGLDL